MLENLLPLKAKIIFDDKYTVDFEVESSDESGHTTTYVVDPDGKKTAIGLTMNSRGFGAQVRALVKSIQENERFIMMMAKNGKFKEVYRPEPYDSTEKSFKLLGPNGDQWISVYYDDVDHLLMDKFAKKLCDIMNQHASEFEKIEEDHYAIPSEERERIYYSEEYQRKLRRPL